MTGSLDLKENAMLRYLLYGALIFIILVGMREVAYLINMLVISLILAMIGAPLYYRFKKHNLGDMAAVGLIMTIYALVIAGFSVLILMSIQVFLGRLPEYESLLSIRISEIVNSLAGHGIDISSYVSTGMSFMPDIGVIVQILVALAGSAGQILMDGFFIFVITCFLFFEIPTLPDRLKKLTGSDSNVGDKYAEMCNSMISWIVVKTKTNIVLGACFGGMLYALGIDLAVFWGVLAIILSYIPYIGLIIVSIPAIVLAWLQLGMMGAVIVIIGICIINAVVENLIFSKFAEKDFNMPALVVIISLVLWTWVLGPIGMMISVPLTIMILIAFSYNENTAWIPTILGMEFTRSQPEAAEVEEKSENKSE